MRRFLIAVVSGSALTMVALGVALRSDWLADTGGAPALSRDDVRQAQHQLKAKGLYDGRIDGVVGPATADALKRYQADNGLPATARLDPPTAERLTGRPVPSGGSDAPSGAAAGARDTVGPPVKLR